MTSNITAERSTGRSLESLGHYKTRLYFDYT